MGEIHKLHGQIYSVQNVPSNHGLDFTKEIYNEVLILTIFVLKYVSSCWHNIERVRVPNRSINSTFERELPHSNHIMEYGNDLHVFVQENITKLIEEQQIVFDTI